jgi:hypothetical protein
MNRNSHTDLHNMLNHGELKKLAPHYGCVIMQTEWESETFIYF